MRVLPANLAPPTAISALVLLYFSSALKAFGDSLLELQLATGRLIVSNDNRAGKWIPREEVIQRSRLGLVNV